MPESTTRRLVVTIALCASLAGMRSTIAAPLSFHLCPWQPGCAERQLARVQRRMITFASPLIYPVHNGASPLGYGHIALWHRFLNGATFSGLARIVELGDQPSNDFLRGHEHFAESDLAFDLIFKQGTGALDPRQPREPHATLARRDPGSNLEVDHEGCYVHGRSDLRCPAMVSVDLAAMAGDSAHPEIPLVINNASVAAPGFTGPGAQFLPLAVGTGPGILADDLAGACGGTLTDFDQRIFEILARTVLPSGCFVPHSPECDAFGEFLGYNLTIFRGSDPHAYRVNVYYYTNEICNDSSCDFANVGPVALEFHMDWDDEGRLTSGTVTVLPTCHGGQDLGCSQLNASMGIFVVPPIFPGNEEEPSTAFQDAPYLFYDSSPYNTFPTVLFARINWAELLKNSALNSGRALGHLPVEADLCREWRVRPLGVAPE